jgi:hypothetical protein
MVRILAQTRHDLSASSTLHPLNLIASSSQARATIAADVRDMNIAAGEVSFAVFTFGPTRMACAFIERPLD